MLNSVKITYKILIFNQCSTLIFFNWSIYIALTLTNNYRDSKHSRCHVRVKWETRSQMIQFKRIFSDTPLIGCSCVLNTYLTSDWDSNSDKYLSLSAAFSRGICAAGWTSAWPGFEPPTFQTGIPPPTWMYTLNYQIVFTSDELYLSISYNFIMQMN